MLRIKVNNAKSFIPHSISKGTTEQRLQKARLFNLKFYDELQYAFRNKEVAPRTFIKNLRAVAGAKLGINICAAESRKDSYTAYSLSGKGENIGYVLCLPLALYSENIHSNTAQTFLKQTQNLFNEAFNPKILKRYAAILSTGFENSKSVVDFYAKNVSGTAILSREALSEFLQGKSPKRNVDALQFMRYKLMSERNTAQASYQIDRRIEKHNNFTYVYKPEHYSLEKYQFEDKFKLLEESLLEIIQSERA